MTSSRRQAGLYATLLDTVFGVIPVRLTPVGRGFGQHIDRGVWRLEFIMEFELREIDSGWLGCGSSRDCWFEGDMHVMGLFQLYIDSIKVLGIQHFGGVLAGMQLGVQVRPPELDMLESVSAPSRDERGALGRREGTRVQANKQVVDVLDCLPARNRLKLFGVCNREKPLE